MGALPQGEQAQFWHEQFLPLKIRSTIHLA
jgi:hypothetical protein